MLSRFTAAAFGLWLIASSPVGSSPLEDLNDEFRNAYNIGAAQVLANLRDTVPILVNRFEQIALYRPGNADPEIYSMRMTVYLEARAVAHTLAALYARLVPYGFGPLDRERLEWLNRYTALIPPAQDEIRTRDDISDDIKLMQIELLDTVRRFAQRVFQMAFLDANSLSELAILLRDGIYRNLHIAAETQLDQFQQKVESWKASYPSLSWERAVCVVIGVHQARNRNLQTQFFDWLFGDRPTLEDRVVFAETLDTPPSLSQEQPTKSLVLLSKVMLDKGLAQLVFDNNYALQSDVLGNSAEGIIRGWGHDTNTRTGTPADNSGRTR